MRGTQAEDAGTRWAFRCYVVVVVVALPTLVFVLGGHRWFHGDDWTFIFGRSIRSADDLFRPNNAHWSTVPVLTFRALYETVGLRAYWPYVLVVASLHLTAASIVRALMRRSGVHPWIATAAATALVFFGAGYANVIWAFQIGVTGSLAFGLAQLLLADHDGPFDRRDAWALAAGLVAIMSSGVGVVTVVTVGLATLMRRGWRAAALHTLPLGAIYLIWASITHPDSSSPLGYPAPKVLWRWLLTSETGAFLALGGSLVGAWILAGFVATGTTWAWRRPGVRAALPTAMALGGVLFMATACAGRWPLGIGASRGSRFLHVIAVFTVPAIALGASVIAAEATRIGRAGRLAVPVVSVILMLGIWPGLDDYNAKPFNDDYYANQKRILTTVVRLPEARMVPRDVRPIPDPFRARFVEIGYLRDAAASRKLPESTEPLTRELREEMRVRLGVRQDPDSLPERGARPCPTVTEPVRMRPRRGTELRITSPVLIRTMAGDEPLFKGVKFVPGAGTDLRIELVDLALEISSGGIGGQPFQLCRPS